MIVRRERRYAVAADGAVIALGCLLIAVSVTVFAAPNGIVPGGVTGLATMVNYLWCAPIGAVSLLCNLPLFWIGRRRLGRGFLSRTLWSVVLSAGLTDVLGRVLPAFRGDPLLSCLSGGALMGLGLGLVLSRGGTTGGSDIVAKLMERRFPHISIGRLVLLVDGVVVALSAAVYRRLESPLYAAVFIFVSSLVTDQLVYGGRRGKMAMILTARQQEITAAIMAGLSRGVTLLDAAGGYTGRPQRMILCAVSREEVFRLKKLVFSADPSAFLMMLTTDEVLGFGWQPPLE